METETYTKIPMLSNEGGKIIKILLGNNIIAEGGTTKAIRIIISTEDNGCYLGNIQLDALKKFLADL